MINIQKWRNNKNIKHRKIYNKAKEIIERELAMEEIETEERLNELRNRFPSLRINIVAGANLTVGSLKDEWLVVNDGRFYALYHGGKFTSRLNKTTESYHIQDVFYDIEFLLASIVSHDNYEFGKKEYSMKDIGNMAFG